MKNGVLAVAALSVMMWPGTQVRAEADRYFRARIDLEQTGPPVPDPRCPAGTVLVSFTGSGNVTRVGRVAAAASHCIVDDPAVEPFSDGEMTLSSSRGDL